MIIEHQPPRIGPSKRAAIILLVTLLHLLLLYWLAMMRVASPPPASVLPPLEVWLFPTGGGSSARDQAEIPTAPQDLSASSNLHVPPEPAPWPETLAAPPEPKNLEPLSGSGLSAIPAPPTPADAREAAEAATAGDGGASGERGSGGGIGAGVGSGRGPGRGRSSGAVLIRGPNGASISQNVSPAALAAVPGSYAVLQCQIRLNQRLDRCRVLSESPPGQGIGRAALARAAEFRFQPPRTSSRFRDRYPITVAIAFPPQADAAP